MNGSSVSQGRRERNPPGVAAAVAELAAGPWLRERMAPLATRLIGEGPAALDAAMERDLAMWSGIVRERDIRLG